MKLRTISIVLIVLVLLTVVTLPAEVSAAGDFEVTRQFDSNPANQGEIVTLTVKVTNNNPDQCKVYWLGAHFDWQAENLYSICTEVSEEDPVSIATGDTESFYIYFEVPSNVQTGNHAYDIQFNYELHDGWLGEWNDYPWQSETLTGFRVEEKDRDGDGVSDSEDTFPDDSSEWKDTDRDGVGNNGDAFPSDPSETKDKDGDGVGDNADVFPNDPDEWEDSDGDGVGDNSDFAPTFKNNVVYIVIVIITVMSILLILVGYFKLRKKKHLQPRSRPIPPEYPPRPPPNDTTQQFPPQQYTPPRYQAQSPKHEAGESMQWDDETTAPPKFCPGCGTETLGRRFCSECGNRIK